MYSVNNIQWGTGTEADGDIVDIKADLIRTDGKVFKINIKSDMSNIAEQGVEMDPVALLALTELGNMWFRHNEFKTKPHLYQNGEAELKTGFDVKWWLDEV